MDGARIFAYKYLKYLNGSLTSSKILRHGTSGFNSHPKEGVMWIFNSLKNPLILPGMKPRPLRPVASALTTTPPRRPLSRVIRNFLQVEQTTSSQEVGLQCVTDLQFPRGTDKSDRLRKVAQPVICRHPDHRRKNCPIETPSYDRGREADMYSTVLNGEIARRSAPLQSTWTNTTGVQ
jgi:hypothetical protein